MAGVDRWQWLMHLGWAVLKFKGHRCGDAALSIGCRPTSGRGLTRVILGHRLAAETANIVPRRLWSAFGDEISRIPCTQGWDHGTSPDICRWPPNFTCRMTKFIDGLFNGLHSRIERCVLSVALGVEPLWKWQILTNILIILIILIDHKRKLGSRPSLV